MSNKEKKIFNANKGNYTQKIWSYALYIKVKLKVPFSKKLFKVAKKYESNIDSAIYEYHSKNGYYLPNDRYLAKELVFQGFVPLNTYKIHSKYAYIMSNRSLDGQYYIYPVKLADNYKISIKGKFTWYQDLFGTLGIPGITKIRYSNEK